MVKKSFLNLSRVVLDRRLLWTLLLLLTAIILLFPVHLRYEYHAIESVYVFGNNLPLFGILFYVWLGILLLLLFSKDKNSEWQRLALVCIFALVYFGFWAINTPTGGHWDELWHMANVKYLQETGHIAPLHPNLSYFQFPALHLFAFSICEICGLGIFATRTLFMVFSSVLFAALSYLLFMKLLKNSYLSSLGVLLIVACLAVPREFWPGNLGVLFLVLVLSLLAWREDRALGIGTSLTLVMIILLAAFIISYLPAPACFILILVGIYLLQKVAKKGVVVWSTIALFVIMFLAWEMYYATFFFSGFLVGRAPTFVEAFMNPIKMLLSTQSEVLVPTVAGDVPLWAKAIKFFWLALAIGFGAILGIWNLVRARKLGSIEVLETGGLLGVTVFLIVTLLTESPGDSTRSLTYFPLFTIPLMLSFLSRFSTRDELSWQNTPPENSGGGLNSNGLHRSFGNLWGWFRRHVFTLLIILFFVLSLPTFLVDKTYICSTTIYPYEHSAGEFVESTYEAEELNLFCDIYTRETYTYYLPEAHFQYVLPARSEEELFAGMNVLIDSFQNSADGGAIFVLSERFRQPPHQPAIVEPTDPGWVEVINRLAQNNKIYDNGHIELYER
jgi:hypothetical protein